MRKSTLYGVKVEIIAVGTGKAIRIAKKGEADMLFVHDPFREEKFIAEGYGVNRRRLCTMILSSQGLRKTLQG